MSRQRFRCTKVLCNLANKQPSSPEYPFWNINQSTFDKANKELSYPLLEAIITQVDFVYIMLNKAT